jgi:hypothetical protein
MAGEWAGFADAWERVRVLQERFVEAQEQARLKAEQARKRGPSGRGGMGM